MKKILLSAIAIVLGVLCSMAQDEPKGKINVFFDYFSRPKSVPFEWEEAIRNSVMEGIQKTNRVNLIDVDTRGTLAIEKERREQENASAGDDMDRMKVMTEEGANLLLTGHVTDVSTKRTTSSDGRSVGYDASLAFTIKVIDPANGTTVYTESFQIPKNIGTTFLKDLNPFKADTEDEAVHKCIGSIVKEMTGFVEKAFPTLGQIIELDETKGNDVKTAYINLGSDNGIAKGAKFEVRVKRIIGGKSSFKLLGEAEVTDVEGEELSKIKIKKGGKEIYDAFNSGQEVVIRSQK